MVMGEVERAFHRILTTGITDEDWVAWTELLTEDVLYVEHVYGVMHGREAIREWIVAVMAPFPHMRFPHSWVAVDEDNGALVVEIQNVLDHPTEPGTSFGFPNFSRLVYAGDGLFSSEEDVYNPSRDAPAAIGAWIEAGGRLLAKPLAAPHA